MSIGNKLIVSGSIFYFALKGAEWIVENVMEEWWHLFTLWFLITSLIYLLRWLLCEEK